MKKIGLFFIVFLTLIQLVRPKKNISNVVSVNSITTIMEVPSDIQKILKTSCYDCHSNNTKYTWYHEIAPMSWGVAYHIKEGKKQLNFDEFATYDDRKRNKMMEEISDEVKEGKMPMKGYVLFHPETKLSIENIDKVINWSEGVLVSHDSK
jgi:hypothetical protein